MRSKISSGVGWEEGPPYAVVTSSLTGSNCFMLLYLFTVFSKMFTSFQMQAFKILLGFMKK